MTVYVDDMRAPFGRFARGRRSPLRVSAYSQLSEEEKEKRRERTRLNRAKDPERTRRQWREYRERRMKEAGATSKPSTCDVCNGNGKICADHNHQSGSFRGWICNDCNLVLGKVKDDAKRLRSLADYLERQR